ncbi:tyrosine-protein kinase family protein [Stieleria varia]|uniref:Septum site-determining protein MinD n=1 Tax=Stieleria varia TaxID=2528005 RepID=A0A5C6A214_9BACT|nr:P-loop NTPase [Stieleria varia]TWT93327.1 Septum site-determining protein MinD [Stieleria varia]
MIKPSAAAPPSPHMASESAAMRDLKLAANISDSAKIWVEPNQDQFLRIDSPENGSPHQPVTPIPQPRTPQSAPTTAASNVLGDNSSDNSSDNIAADPDAAVMLQSLHSQIVMYGCVDDASHAVLHSTVDYPVVETPPAENAQQAAEPAPLIDWQTEIDEFVDDPVHESVDELAYETPPAASIATPATEEPETYTSTSSPQQWAKTPWPGAQWEVDVFEVPSSVASLFFDESFFKSIANRMRETVADGLRSLAVTSVRSGEGRSTVAIGTAIAAAATGLRVALVDCDLSKPSLVDDLRLELDYGWVEAIRCGIPLSQVAVSSLEDGVTLIPLLPPAPGHPVAAAAEVAALMQTLQGQFDLLVIDAPASDAAVLQVICQGVDSAVITQDLRSTRSGDIQQLATRLRHFGVRGIGVVENFAVE